MITSALRSTISRRYLPSFILTASLGACLAGWATWANLESGWTTAAAATAVQVVLCAVLIVLSAGVTEQICYLIGGTSRRLIAAVAAGAILWTVVPSAAHYALGTPDALLTAAPTVLLGIVLPIFLALGLLPSDAVN